MKTVIYFLIAMWLYVLLGLTRYCTLPLYCVGIKGEDSGKLGCLKLGDHEENTSRYVTIKVLGEYLGPTMLTSTLK